MRPIEKAAIAACGNNYDSSSGGAETIATSWPVMALIGGGPGSEAPENEKRRWRRIARAAILAFLDDIDVEALARARIERDGGKWEYMGEMFRKRERDKILDVLSALRAQAGDPE